jgi:hypothetical protein
MAIVNRYLNPSTYIKMAGAAGKAQRVSQTYDEEQAALRRKEAAELAQKQRLEAGKFETDENIRQAKAMAPIQAEAYEKAEGIRRESAAKQQETETQQKLELAAAERKAEQDQLKQMANITDAEIDSLSISPEYKDMLKTAARLKVQTGNDMTKLLLDQYNEKQVQENMRQYQDQVRQQTGIEVANTDARAVVEGHQQSILGELAKRQVTQLWAQKQSETVRDELTATINSVMQDDKIPEDLKAATVKALVETRFRDLELKFQIASATDNAVDSMINKYFPKPIVTPQNPTEVTPKPVAPVTRSPQGYGAQGLYVPSQSTATPKPTTPTTGFAGVYNPSELKATKPEAAKGPKKLTRDVAQQFYDMTDPKLPKEQRLASAKDMAQKAGYIE